MSRPVRSATYNEPSLTGAQLHVMQHKEVLEARGPAAPKTCWMRFEDWVWYNNHTAFEYHVNQYYGCFRNHRKCALWFRRFLLFCMAALIGLFFYRFGADGGAKRVGTEFRFFTTWGLWLTFFTVLAGSFVTNDDINPVEDYNYQDEKFLRSKYSPFRAWKWFAFLY